MIKLDKNKVREKIENRIYADLEAGRVGGAQVCVKQDGEVIYENCFGFSDNGKELAPNTIFRLASMTKPITGVAIMKQINRGLVSLNDPIDKFIPEYEEMNIGALDADRNIVITGKAKEKMRVLHLLTHSSGIECGEVGGKINSSIPKGTMVDLKSATETYAKYPLSFDPYTSQAYSGCLGFDLLARIVEITSGMTYDKYLKKEIFEPLGMTDTSFQPTDEEWGRMVCLHNLADGKSVFYPVNRNHIFGDFPTSYFCGGAGLASTVSDYMKFADMLLANGKMPNGDTLIDEDLVRQMRTPALPEHIMPGSQRWGLSMRVITDDNYKRLPKNTYGWSGAYGTHFWVDPDNKITAVYMKNSHYDGGAGAVTAANFEEDVYL